MDQKDESLIFEGRAPDGRLFRVYSDGSTTGFPDGMVVANHFYPKLCLLRSVAEQAIAAGLVPEQEAWRVRSTWR